MVKTFTVHALHHKEISPGKGSIVWLLSDEKGLPRKVNGITDIDTTGVIVAIQAIYKREIPLVEKLHAVEKGDAVTLDFAGFNQQQNYGPREVYNNMRAQEKLSGLSANTMRVALGIAAVALVWFAYTAFADISQMSINLVGK